VHGLLFAASKANEELPDMLVVDGVCFIPCSQLLSHGANASHALIYEGCFGYVLVDFGNRQVLVLISTLKSLGVVFVTSYCFSNTLAYEITRYEYIAQCTCCAREGGQSRTAVLNICSRADSLLNKVRKLLAKSPCRHSSESLCLEIVFRIANTGSSIGTLTLTMQGFLR
jgi:hypothetical protein